MFGRLLLIALFSLSLEMNAHAAFAANDLSCEIFRPAVKGVLARCEGPSRTHNSIAIELIGHAPNAVSEVRLTGGDGNFRQTLKLTAEPLIDIETVGILHMDFNFDGFEDFAIMEFLPAGPNVPYLYYLHDSQTDRFTPNADLARITAPEFRATDGQIISYWRDSAAVSGKDVYVWKDGKPQLKSRSEERRSGTDCIRTHYLQRDGKLTELSKDACE